MIFQKRNKWLVELAWIDYINFLIVRQQKNALPYESLTTAILRSPVDFRQLLAETLDAYRTAFR
ncbi:hypothetical protein [Paenibacillus sp. A3]|uniref:hypothetical protein n=1 Tax=Paenibacillus sp. A3 TaxID=1337054 RepID=UPI0012FC6D26|nr:hypothetical protein [Paenibacillus sp. A3]